MRQPRLTQPGLERWHRIRRKLGWADFVALLYEDLAEAFPMPFALDRWKEHPLASLTHDEAEKIVLAAIDEPSDDGPSFLRRATRALGLPSGGELSSLPKVQLNHRVLELAGGRVALYQVQAYPGLSFHERFTFVADTDAERVLVGLAAVAVRANPPTTWTSEQLAATRGKVPAFDHIFGIRGYPPAERAASDLRMEVRWA